MTENDPKTDDPNQPPADGPGQAEEGEESGTGDTSQDAPGGGSGTDDKQSPN